MTNPEGVTAEPVEETTPQDVKIEAVEAPTEETDAEVSPDVESEEVVETVEDKLTRLEREVAGKQKKIDRQTAANHASRERYEKQTQEFDKLSQLVQQQKPDAEPSIEDFEAHEDYSKARDQFIEKRAISNAQEQFVEQQRQVQEQQVTMERHKLRQSQEVEYLAENPMYTASSNEVDSYIKTLSEMSSGTAEAVIGQLYDGNVPAVIDYFGANNGENLDQLGEISRMSAPRAAVEMYKIQQSLLTTPTKRQEKTKPTPVKTARGGSSSAKPLSKQTGKGVLDWVNS